MKKIESNTIDQFPSNGVLSESTVAEQHHG